MRFKKKTNFKTFKKISSPHSLERVISFFTPKERLCKEYGITTFLQIKNYYFKILQRIVKFSIRLSMSITKNENNTLKNNKQLILPSIFCAL